MNKLNNTFPTQKIRGNNSKFVFTENRRIGMYDTKPQFLLVKSLTRVYELKITKKHFHRVRDIFEGDCKNSCSSEVT
jgi:hypothetical protein